MFTVDTLPECRRCKSTDITPKYIENGDLICRGCQSLKNKIRYLNNKGKYCRKGKGDYIQKNFEYGSNNWAQRKVSFWKRYDVKRFKETICDLNKQDVLAIIKMACDYCGDTTEQITADRKDNDKGHSKCNIVPACYTCNQTRWSSFSYEEMKKIGLTIKKIKFERKN